MTEKVGDVTVDPCVTVFIKLFLWVMGCSYAVNKTVFQMNFQLPVRQSFFKLSECQKEEKMNADDDDNQVARVKSQRPICQIIPNHSAYNTAADTTCDNHYFEYWFLLLQ